jgi:hypothetical protein
VWLKLYFLGSVVRFFFCGDPRYAPLPIKCRRLGLRLPDFSFRFNFLINGNVGRPFSRNLDPRSGQRTAKPSISGNFSCKRNENSSRISRFADRESTDEIFLCDFSRYK